MCKQKECNDIVLKQLEQHASGRSCDCFSCLMHCENDGKNKHQYFCCWCMRNIWLFLMLDVLKRINCVQVVRMHLYFSEMSGTLSILTCVRLHLHTPCFLRNKHARVDAGKIQRGACGFINLLAVFFWFQTRAHALAAFRFPDVAMPHSGQVQQ